jgi:hypothetical protein
VNSGYSREEMRRLYAPSEPVELAGGRYTLVAQDAAKMAPGLLIWDAAAGGYRRACIYPTDEQAAIDAGPRLTAPRFRVSTPAPSGSPWSARPDTNTTLLQRKTTP